MSERYAVFGNPIAHSKSPQIHAEFARQTAQNMHYEAILAPVDGFAAAVDRFRFEGGLGANVTVPFKQAAYHYATRLTERARLAQAVNTLQFDADQVVGDNTDGAGLVQDIQENLGFSISAKRVLLMGAGGAARGVLLPLLACQPLSITIANRTLSKARDLAQHFAAHGMLQASDYPSLAGLQFDLVINATSSSLNDALPPLPSQLFTPASLAYDLMYGQGLTPFLAFAEQQQAQTLADGLGMLVEQAAEAFYVWRGVRPETLPVIAQFRKT